MKRNFFQNRIVLLQLETLGSVLPVLGGNVAGSAGHATIFVLCALHDYLYAIAFLCHEICFEKRSAKVREFLFFRTFCEKISSNEEQSVLWTIER